MGHQKFNREAMQALKASQYSSATLPSSGMEVCIRKMTVGEVREIFGKAKKGASNAELQAEGVRRSDKMLSMCVVDTETKEPLLTPDDVREMPAQEIGEMVKEVLRVNGMLNEKEADEAGKD